jgi:sensor histidine kinase YesM
MKNKWFYNSYSFRIFSPIVIGILAYLLILLFFDSVDQIGSNFFGREVAFLILLSFLILEFNRINIILLNKIFDFERNLKTRIIIQFVVSVLLGLLIISTVLYLYFVLFEGFSTIITELITFNLIFFFVAFFYNLYFLSLMFLNKRNDAKINEESIKKKSLELEMETFKNHVNPTFLFQSLETIISELHRNKKKADEQISNLAQVYRFTLENQDSELITLDKEICSLMPILRLLKAKYKEALQSNINIEKNDEKYVIPGTLQIIIEYAIARNIISSSLPLNLNIISNNNFLMIDYSLNPKLEICANVNTRLDFLIKTYQYFSKEGITVSNMGNISIIKIPLLLLEEE